MAARVGAQLTVDGPVVRARTNAGDWGTTNLAHDLGGPNRSGACRVYSQPTFETQRNAAKRPGASACVYACARAAEDARATLRADGSLAGAARAIGSAAATAPTSQDVPTNPARSPSGLGLGDDVRAITRLCGARRDGDLPRARAGGGARPGRWEMKASSPARALARHTPSPAALGAGAAPRRRGALEVTRGAHLRLLGLFSRWRNALREFAMGQSVSSAWHGRNINEALRLAEEGPAEALVEVRGGAGKKERFWLPSGTRPRRTLATSRFFFGSRLLLRGATAFARICAVGRLWGAQEGCKVGLAGAVGGNGARG